jgi:hypothetical protein
MNHWLLVFHDIWSVLRYVVPFACSILVWEVAKDDWNGRTEPNLLSFFVFIFCILIYLFAIG